MIQHVLQTRASAIDQIKHDYWAAKESNRQIEDVLLLQGWVAYQMLFGDRATLWGYLQAMVEGRTEEAGSLYNALYRQRAREAGYVGSLTELGVWGKAMLRDGYDAAKITRVEAVGMRVYLRSWLAVPDGTPHGIDSTPDSEMFDALLGAGLSELEARRVRRESLEAALRVQKREEGASLSSEQARARALVARTAPDAPLGRQEQNTVFLQAAQAMAAKMPQEFAGALKAVQAGQPDRAAPKPTAAATHFITEQFKPPTFVEWGGWHAHSFVTGRLRGEGEIRFHAHHVPLGEHEARRSDGPQVIVFAPEGEHIPQPGGTTFTAHHKDFSPRRDAEKLLALLEYYAVQWQRYQAHVRGEADPWPVLPPTAFVVPVGAWHGA